MSLTASSLSSSVADPTQASANELKAYQAWLDLAEDVVCFLDPNGQFQKMNQAFWHSLGYTKAYFDQRDFLSLVHPEDQPSARTYLAAANKSPSAEFTLRFRHQDSTYHQLLWQLQPVPDTTMIMAVGRQAVAPQKARPDCFQPEDTLRLLAENTNDVVALHHLNGVVSYVSPSAEKVLGYSNDDLVGQNPFLFCLHPEDTEQVHSDLLQQLLVTHDTHHTTPVTYRIRKQDGSYTWFETTAKKVTDQWGQTKALISSSRDVSQRKKSEAHAQQLTEQLKISNEELDNFAYIASHDLQEPLRVVASYLQVLQRRYQPQLDDRAGKFIDYAVDGATRMKRLITDLLAYSRVNNMHQEQQPVDLNRVMAQVVQELSLRIGQTQASLSYPKLPVVYANETLMYRVFSNLVSNAIKFRSTQPPEINIAIEESQQCWQFSVSDNGIGISPEYGDTVFDIFRRLNGHKYEGTGMGLSIVKKVIDNHRGAINLKSQEGQGATFYFTLPKQLHCDCTTDPA